MRGRDGREERSRLLHRNLQGLAFYHRVTHAADGCAGLMAMTCRITMWSKKSRNATTLHPLKERLHRVLICPAGVIVVHRSKEEFARGELCVAARAVEDRRLSMRSCVG
jgi:hypothetical protein